MLATSTTGLVALMMMSRDLFQRELAYQTTIAIASTMLTLGLITEAEFSDFDSRMLAKYQPPIGLLISNNKAST